MDSPLNAIMLGGYVSLESAPVYRGVGVIVLADGPALEEARLAGLTCHAVDISNPDECLNLILELELDSHLMAVLPVTDPGLDTAAYLAKILDVVCDPLTLSQ